MKRSGVPWAWRGKTHAGFCVCAILFFALSFCLLPARAQEWSPGGYLNAYGGANLMNDIVVSSGVQSYKGADIGYRAGLAMGYEFRPWLGLEFETGFQENSLKDLHSSSVKAMPLILNAVFRYPNPTRIVPWLGIGAGGAVSTLDAPAGADLSLVFAYQATLGVEYELTPQLRAGLLYKFLGAADQDYSIAGSHFQAKDAYSHFIGANLSWNF